MWNYSPNANESSTVFLRKLVAKLYMYNEALVVETLPQKHTDALVVADSWDTPEAWPSRQNEYKNIVVGDYRYQYPIWGKQRTAFQAQSHRHPAGAQRAVRVLFPSAPRGGKGL